MKYSPGNGNLTWVVGGKVGVRIPEGKGSGEVRGKSSNEWGWAQVHQQLWGG